MTGTITELALAAALFVGLHLGIASTSLRPALIGRLGENAYRGVFSVSALIPLVWMCVAYGHAPTIPLWGPSPFLGGLIWLASFAALLLIVASAMAPSPAGGDPSADSPERAAMPHGVQRITRNPQLWGIGLWASAHFAASGDAASLVLFGSLAVLAVAGSYILDARKRSAGEAAWLRFAAVTSNTPFAAILSGRQALVVGELPPKAPLIAVAVFAVLVFLHPYVVTVSAFPQ